MGEIERKLIALAGRAPLAGYVQSGHYCMIQLKHEYNISDYYVVEILERLRVSGEIRDLYVNYDTDDRHILSYKFR